MLKRLSRNLGAILAWLLVCGLALFIIIVGADFIQAFAINVLKDADWVYFNTTQANSTVKASVQFYYVMAGLLWLGFFILMEHMLITTGVPQKLVIRRTLFALGIEALILAVLHLGMFIMQPASLLSLGLAAGEGLLGGFLVFISRRKPGPAAA